MATNQVNIEIWKEILRYCTKLSHDERAVLHRSIEAILESNQHSQVDLGRLVKIESDIQGLQELAIANTRKLSHLDEGVVSHDKSIDKVKNLEHQLTQLYMKQQGVISGIDSEYRKLDNRLENLTTTVERIVDILSNQATETINELTDKKLVGEYE